MKESARKSHVETAKERYERYVRWTEPAMLVLTVLFVAVALLRGVESHSPEFETVLATFEWILWLAFPIEFALMHRLSPTPASTFRERWWEIPIMIVTLPALGFFFRRLAPLPFLRFLRGTRAVRMLRLTRFSGLIARYTESLRTVLTRHGLQYVLAGAVVLYVISTFLVFVVESEGNNPIQSYREALWWGITAMTTLPNDGNFPVTTAGKGIAVFVVFLGLTVVSLITANIAAFLVDDESPWDSKRIDAMTEQLERIEKKLNERP